MTKEKVMKQIISKGKAMNFATTSDMIEWIKNTAAKNGYVFIGDGEMMTWKKA